MAPNLHRLGLMKVFIGSAVILLTLAPATAKPSSTVSLGHFGDWKAYRHSAQSQAGKPQVSCFMVSAPAQQKGDFKKRGQPHLMITHTPNAKGNPEDVVSVGAGYPYLSETDVTLTITGMKSGHQTQFALFTQNDQAWAKDAATDKAIIKALHKGKSLVVEGVSQRGSTTQDRYSLQGTAQAYKSLIKGCAPSAAGTIKATKSPYQKSHSPKSNAAPSLKAVLTKARKSAQNQGKSS